MMEKEPTKGGSLEKKVFQDGGNDHVSNANEKSNK